MITIDVCHVDGIVAMEFEVEGFVILGHLDEVHARELLQRLRVAVADQCKWIEEENNDEG